MIVSAGGVRHGNSILMGMNRQRRSRQRAEDQAERQQHQDKETGHVL
jgi:hypothetical protein